MKSRDGKSQRREDKRRKKKIKKRKSQKKEDQVREKVGGSWNTVFFMFFQWFEAPEGRKVGSLKRRVRSQLARWEMINCTPLWREAHFQVKMYKAHQVRSAFRSWDVKKCTPLRRESHFKFKMHTKHHARTTLGSCDVEKVHRPCGTKHISKSKCTKHTSSGPLLDVQISFRVDCAPCQKWAKREGFVAFPKTMAGVGHFKRICKDAFSVAGAVQETCSSVLGGPGADFLRVVAFWSIRSSVLGRWFCVTGAALRMIWHQFFVAGAAL